MAWNTFKLDGWSEEQILQLRADIGNLNRVDDHAHILTCVTHWLAKDKNEVVSITELATAGNMRAWVRKTERVSLKVLRRWARNLLDALRHVHAADPPVVLRTLCTRTIYVNGHTAEVRIGHFMQSTQLVPTSPLQGVPGAPSHPPRHLPLRPLASPPRTTGTSCLQTCASPRLLLQK